MASSQGGDFDFLNKSRNGWKWVKSNGNYYLKSELLQQAGFNHGFFTRLWNGHNPNQLSELLKEGASVFFLKQVHSNKVIEVPNKKDCISIEADGLISNKKNQSLWVYTADCIPGLVADPVTGKVCAFHAGWRGLASNIIQKVLTRMEKMGANKESLLIALGPSISSKNYPVGPEVAEAILESLIWGKASQKSKTKQKFNLTEKKDVFLEDTVSGRIFLDIRLGAFDQLRQADLGINQIAICPLCTYKESKLFHSWRRDKFKAVQWSGVVSKE